MPVPVVSSAVRIVPPVMIAVEVKFPLKFPEVAFISPVMVAEVAVTAPALVTVNSLSLPIAIPSVPI